MRRRALRLAQLSADCQRVLERSLIGVVVMPEILSTSGRPSCSTSPPPGAITEAGLRNDVSVGIQYISSWLRGDGAAGINGLMEDAATAEITRSQVWQWIRHGCSVREGKRVTRERVRRIADEEPQDLDVADGARELFEEVALADELAEFLTLPAYERLP